MHPSNRGSAVSACKVSVNNAVEFDLSPLMSKDEPHQWRDSATGTIYEATICNSMRLLDGHCGVDNAVATESYTCDVYGRYDAWQLTSFLDEANPKSGVMLSYGNGGQCHSTTAGKSSAIFMIACDISATSFGAALNKVESSSDDCQHMFYFTSLAGCGYDKVDQGGNDASGTQGLGTAGIVILTIIAAMLLYCSIGAAYKRSVYGSTGVESLPHIELCRKCYRELVYWSFVSSNSVLSALNIFGADGHTYGEEERLGGGDPRRSSGGGRNHGYRPVGGSNSAGGRFSDDSNSMQSVAYDTKPPANLAQGQQKLAGYAPPKAASAVIAAASAASATATAAAQQAAHTIVSKTSAAASAATSAASTAVSGRAAKARQADYMMQYDATASTISGTSYVGPADPGGQPWQSEGFVGQQRAEDV